MIPSVIIRTEERKSVKLGGLWFYHSTRRRDFFVPISSVILGLDKHVVIRMESKDKEYIRFDEIKEIQFV